MVVLDTGVIIDHLRRKSGTSTLVSLVDAYPKEQLSLSVISIQELYEGKSTLVSEKEKELLTVISPLKILPYTYEIAKLAGNIARDTTQRMSLADAAIAATVITQGAQLCTLNRKDFEDIPHISLVLLP